MEREFDFDLSVVLPSMNEGDSIRKFYEELVEKLESTDLSYEIIAIDTPSDNDSFKVAKEFARKYPNFTAIALSERRKAGSGKTVQYMIGFDLALGKYIIQMDTDGQDNPADLPKFISKLDDGFDLVVGHKQNRKDSSFYMLQSKIGNFVNKVFTGSKVHDMNCGFKGYQAHVAKSLNLKGRWYRMIPAILQSRGFKVTEVPIDNRKRNYGETNFNFINRFQSGFDLFIIGILIRSGDTPIYFWGWIALILGLLSVLLFTTSFILNDQVWRIIMVVISMGTFVIGVNSFFFGMLGEFRRFEERFEWDERDIKAFYKSDHNPGNSN